jgi:hypothetical protein
MGIIRYLLIFLVIYFFIRLIKRILQPAEKNPNIKGKGSQNHTQKRNLDIEDADYEEIE